ncbi:MAG: 16S rRNA (cytosine(1402)-N(4))-methyltransferase RsmH [Firmicutes bacterium]|nr:16S rRNA (cytosine(1402)-N(4))-methyltransferase RsmH [Bacillota bacterium]
MYHVPVLAKEVIEALSIKKDGLYFDGTLGGGGHSELILSKGGRVIGTDRDADAIAECEKRFKGYEGRYTLYKENFKNAKEILKGQALDGALLDLGVSSHQIDTAERGMSYRLDGKLDMRMDQSQYLTALEVVGQYGETDLIRILKEYGEERFAKRIAAAIVRERGVSPIATTGRLVEIIKASVPAFYQNPAMRSFMGIRLEVNNELRGLDMSIEEIFSYLISGGRLCVIAFHSLEDRIVKRTFQRLSADCVCDKSLPVCVCNHKAEGRLLGRFRPSMAELAVNSRSGSATLRVLEKI